MYINKVLCICKWKFAHRRKLTTLVIYSLSLTTPCFAQHGLSRTAAERASMNAWKLEKEKLLPAARKVWQEGGIRFGKYNMAIAYRVFGEKPSDGRSLYISLHGGGNAPVEVNDQQWQNQRMLYDIKEGLCIVPRAPTNTWNLWHEDHIDNFLDSLIRYAIVMEDVNPDKVYLLGYSAGGDGVYQLAPRMADRWAAAAMMAGHPGDADALNLRNLPFAIFMGGLDTAYHRNTLAVAFKKRLDSLKRADPKGFEHDFHLYPDKAHWMDRRDTIAISWLASHKRNPFPNKVVWVQDDRVRSHAYWLSAPRSAQVKGATTEVSIVGNEVHIHENSFSELEINLNDHLLNLDKPVSIRQNGRLLFRKRLKRSLGIIRTTMQEYQEPKMVFSVKLVVRGKRVSVSGAAK